ncbi:ABC transporter permease [Lacticaseibacillus suibinensis]|uniref:ABC transporter permease n=1 Tax=Lacticaseibacillus suibinensis TaxID=2486011 RepID=UPI000F769B1B|nr:ABC transporter permease [Lacticaseibacillus suibinensis]
MRTRGMIKRVMTEMLRDKRTLALMFVAPLLILTLIYFLFQSSGNTTATLAVKNVDFTLQTALKNDNLNLKATTSDDSAKRIIRQHDYAGMLVQSGDKLTLTLANDDPTKATIIKSSLQAAQIKLKTKAAGAALQAQAKAIKQMSTALAAATKAAGITAPPAQTGTAQAAGNTSYQTKTHYLYGDKDSTFFATLLPILMSFIVFFFVFLISGIALLRERTTGTLYRLLATPVRRGEIITGYLTGYGLFAVIQTLLIVVFTMYAFKIQILGSIWLVILINLLLAMLALTMGLFISTFAGSEFQMVQFIPVVVIPQIFFSGIIPVATMPGWLQAIAHIMPLYYGAGAMSQVVEKGAGLSAIWLDLLIMLAFAAVFLLLNVQTMKKYRQV